MPPKPELRSWRNCYGSRPARRGRACPVPCQRSGTTFDPGDRRPSLRVRAAPAPLVDGLQHSRRRQRQIRNPESQLVPDRIRHDRQSRHDRGLPHAAHAVRVERIRHLDDLGVDHWHVRRHRHPVVQEAGVLHDAVVVVDVFLVERPADSLHGTALYLALHVGRVDGPSRVLNRGEAQHVDLAGLGVDHGVGEVAGERRPDTLCVQAGPAQQRATGSASATGNVRQRQRLHIRVDPRLRHGFAV